MINGKVLKAKLKENNITQTEFADLLGVNQSSVANWVSGRFAPTREKVKKIADLLDCTVDELEGKTPIDMDIKKNADGYTDPTAYKAIKNYMMGEEKYMRGSIYEYYLSNGSVKDALVVANDEREGDRFISIIVLEDKPRGKYTAPVMYGGEMWANCNCVSYADRSRLGSCQHTVTEKEMDLINTMIANALGLKHVDCDGKCTAVLRMEKELRDAIKENIALKEEMKNTTASSPAPAEITILTTERDLYKKLYEDMLNRMIG